MQKYFVLFLLLSIFTVSFCAELPSTFKKCSRNRKDFQKCLIVAVEDAIHQLDQPFKDVGLPSIDPLEIPSLSIAPGSGAVGFQQNYKNVSITGFSKPKITKFNINFDGKVVELRCNFTKIIVSFDYDFDGNILVIPFHGKGPGVLTISTAEFILDFKLEEYEKKGDIYYKIVEGKLNLTPGHVHFKLDNLFNGDEQLGKNINNVFNENWELLVADIKTSYEEVFGQIFTSYFDRLLERVPVSKMFPLN